MLAATRLAELVKALDPSDAALIKQVICQYGPLPIAHNLDPDRLLSRLASDKKTLQGKVHFVLPTSIGTVKVVSGIDEQFVRQAMVESLQVV